MNNAYLSLLIEKALPIPEQFHQAFGGLSHQQFNWKPSPKQWSVGECISHLINTNRRYLPIIKRVAEGNHHNRLITKIPGLSSMWGRMLLNMVSPEIKRKVKTLRPFQPAASNIGNHLLIELAQLQSDLLVLLEESDAVDHKKTIITSPASKLITYSLKDTCNILIDHELRHYNQAVAVRQMDSFPH